MNFIALYTHTHTHTRVFSPINTDTHNIAFLSFLFFPSNLANYPKETFHGMIWSNELFPKNSFLMGPSWEEPDHTWEEQVFLLPQSFSLPFHQPVSFIHTLVCARFWVLGLPRSQPYLPRIKLNLTKKVTLKVTRDAATMPLYIHVSLESHILAVLSRFLLSELFVLMGDSESPVTGIVQQEAENGEELKKPQRHRMSATAPRWQRLWPRVGAALSQDPVSLYFSFQIL